MAGMAAPPVAWGGVACRLRQLPPAFVALAQVADGQGVGRTGRLGSQDGPFGGAKQAVLRCRTACFGQPPGLHPWRWRLGAHLFLVTVCIALPVLSSIYIFSWLFVADITEKPSTPAQNTVPSVGFTVRASEPDVLTT